uniref:Uncharacterized protein n=1 Tax=Ditylenchus dipsaci TaxID=166011 RepID=A0A915E754_9BILA
MNQMKMSDLLKYAQAIQQCQMIQTCIMLFPLKVETMLNEWSLDILEKPPATFPTPTMDEFEEAWKCKRIIQRPESRIGEQPNWNLQNFTAEQKWIRYKKLRSSVYKCNGEGAVAGQNLLVSSISRFPIPALFF